MADLSTPGKVAGESYIRDLVHGSLSVEDGRVGRLLIASADMRACRREHANMRAVSTDARTDARTHTCTVAHIQAGTHARTQISMHAGKHAHNAAHAHMHACKQVSAFARRTCMYMQARTFAHTHILMHTRTHALRHKTIITIIKFNKVRRAKGFYLAIRQSELAERNILLPFPFATVKATRRIRLRR